MPHIILIAAPGMGHVLPLLHLAHAAAVAGIESTFLASDVPLAQLKSSGQLAPLAHPLLHLGALPSQGVTWEDYSTKGPAAVMPLYQQMIAPTTAALGALAVSPPVAAPGVLDALTGAPLAPAAAPATQVVGAPFIFFGPPVAKQHGLKWTTLVDTSVIGSLVTIQVAAAAAAARDAGAADDAALCTDGVRVNDYMSVPASDLINVFGETALTAKSPTGFAGLVDASDALLVNTAKGLDAQLLPYLAPRPDVPVLPLGPLFLRAPTAPLTPDLTTFLNQRSQRTVLYVGAGSFASLSEKDAGDLVAVLADTQVPFVWADGARRGAGSAAGQAAQDLVSFGQGIIVPWAPQAAILEHPSVGLFYSHGGWNSVLESLAGGVPLLLKPSHAEQVLNARILSDERGVGRRVTTERGAGHQIRRFAVGDWTAETDAAGRAQATIKAALGTAGDSTAAWAQWVRSL